MVEFKSDVCANFAEATSREWLETNGLGGFASSTISGINTRRYHGLLVAATNPPTGRMVLLSKLEETLVINGEQFELSANQYPGTVYPQGYQYLTGFRLDPYPIFTFTVGGIRVIKAIAMIHGENTTVVKYEVDGLDKKNADIRLEIRPLIAFRDYHSLTHENSAIMHDYCSELGLFRLSPYAGLPELCIAHNADGVLPTGDWYRNFQYSEEQARGLDFQEDLFQPLVMSFTLGASKPAFVIASTSVQVAERSEELLDSERARRARLVTGAPGGCDLIPDLLRAADQFIVSRGEQKTIIAGYHWFTDWGRDTMIALPGLCLATGRPEVAKSIISEFAKYVDQGMLPNRFPDKGEEPEYNTVDATLWYFEAICAYLCYTGDFEFVRDELYSLLAEIIDWHVKGTRYGIKVDSDGLLNSGEEGVQLTWMDARVGDWVVTPRRGKPVEIQALWYNALKIMEELSHRFDDAVAERRYARMAAKARRSFYQQFWNRESGCLYDVVDCGSDGAVGSDRSKDGSIRPNQVLAISLHHSIGRGYGKEVLTLVARELLTPVGLRSLSPNDPRYVGKYGGGPLERDGAYHQGTVWAWLMGPFITAYVKTYGRHAKRDPQVLQWLSGFRDHLCEAGLGQISEIFDGDAPFTPNGCIAQAWSVAELLRAITEDVLPPTAAGELKSAKSRLRTRAPRSVLHRWRRK